MTSTDYTARSASRTAILARMGATDNATWHHWPTTTTAVDLVNGVIYMAMDRGASHDEWLALLDLASEHGYTGDGQPENLGLDGITVWRMPIPAARRLPLSLPSWPVNPLAAVNLN